MAGTKEIRTQIASVKSTQKITKAMQMVATSKMRRAQDRMKLARPYADKIRNVIGNLTHANPDYRHPFMATRDAKNVGIIVISTDRGLAGGLNANVFKQTLLLVKEWQEKGASVSLTVMGAKGMAFFRRLNNLPMLASVSGLGDKPHAKDLIGVVKVMLDAYREGRIDRLLLVHAEFVNTMTQKPRGTAAAGGAFGQGHAAGSLGLHLRARCRCDSRWPADALCGVAGVSRRRGKRRFRNGCAHGGDEGGDG
jgi:F-type H+-transporting ATPase subunit gamma